MKLVANHCCEAIYWKKDNSPSRNGTTFNDLIQQEMIVVKQKAGKKALRSWDFLSRLDLEKIFTSVLEVFSFSWKSPWSADFALENSWEISFNFFFMSRLTFLQHYWGQCFGESLNQQQSTWNALPGLTISDLVPRAGILIVR